MKAIEDYLRKDVGRPDLTSWEEIRVAYAKRAVTLVGADYQSPSYRHSLHPQAGSRTGKIIANINDYTRDRHDRAMGYERQFAREYLPRVGILPIYPYVTSSGMAALTTIVTMLHQVHGANHTILVGKHSYFQNWQLLATSFTKVIPFNESDAEEWKRLITQEKPLAIFVDTICNVSSLEIPPVEGIAQYYRKQKGRKYLVVDNSLLGYGFPWKKVLRQRSRSLSVVGWESLNKFYQYGLDRTTGGVVWASDESTSLQLFHARMNSGTILSDYGCAMLPTPKRGIMKKYLARIHRNGDLLVSYLRDHSNNSHVTIKRADTGYGFDGAQVVVNFAKKRSYAQLQAMVKKMINEAKMRGVELVAGSSFGMPVTRLYVTARKTDYAQMFFRISVGTEEEEAVHTIGEIIASNL